MSDILTKNHVYRKSICAIGIMRRSDFGQFLPGMKGFALKSIGSSHTFTLFT
jgi:hypothetical protein